MANFEVLEDNTVRARFRRASHMKVIEAFWAHRPSVLYPRIECPVLLMPARGSGDLLSGEWRQAREESIALAGHRMPQSKTVWLEDSVHDVPLQRPKLVARVIEEHIREGFFA